MKKALYTIIIISIFLAVSGNAYAKEGDCGYEGGISSCQNQLNSKNSNEYEYQEVVFITGKSVVLKGKVTVKKKTANNTETTTYTYNIADTNKNSLKRTINLQTKTVKKGDQIVKETTIYGKPTETIVIEGKTYTLNTYNITKSSIVDIKPSVEYFAGDFEGEKIYKVKETDDLITISTKGQFYGYNQNWSNAEVQMIDYLISNQSQGNNWSGTAKVKLSSTLTTQLNYVKNYPEEISFDGGYVQSQRNISTLVYQTSMPEFDKNGIATDKIINKKGNLKIESFPKEKRLVVHDLSGVRGHWAEEDIKKLYSLEIFDEHPSIFIANQYMSRGEFAKALYKFMNIEQENTTSNKKKTTKVLPQYEDVPVNDPLFNYIEFLTNKNIMVGYGDGKFYPQDTITRAQVIYTFIKLLGLESMSKDEYPVTIFKDNDDIPTWALRSIYVANKIEIVQGDNGYVMPNKCITKAEAAATINRLITYMSKNMPKNYGDKLISY